MVANTIQTSRQQGSHRDVLTIVIASATVQTFAKFISESVATALPLAPLRGYKIKATISKNIRYSGLLFIRNLAITGHSLSLLYEMLEIHTGIPYYKPYQELTSVVS